MALTNVTSFQNNNWFYYNFLIDISIKVNGTLLKLKTSQVNGGMLEKDFDADNLPVLLVDVTTPSNLQITEDMDFIVSIHKFIGGKENTISGKKKVFYDTFRPIVRDSTPLDIEATNKANIQLDLTDEELANRDMSYTRTFILIKKSLMTQSKFICNKVLSDVTMTNALAYLLTASGCKNVLLSNLDNTQIYPELLLLPIPLISQLKYLRSYYGFHKEDTTIFMDYDTMYLTRMNGKCSAWKRNEPKTICFNLNTSITDSTNIIQGQRQAGDIIYVNISRDSFATINESTIRDQTVGSSILLYDSTSDITQLIEGKNTPMGNSTKTTMTTYGHNEYTANQLTLRSAEANTMVQIKCENLDFTYFTPNKQYRILGTRTSVSKNLLGNYRLTRIVNSFAKSGDHFNSVSVLTLVKVD